MGFFIFIAAIVASLFAVIRFRRAPQIYWLTATVIAAFLIWNQYAFNSCEGGCNIRVDLLLILPVVALAVVFSLNALRKG